MSLIPKEKLKTDFWLHKCSAKEGSLVYNEIGIVCKFCGKTEAETKADNEWQQNK